MKFSTVVIINAVVALVYGIALVLLPGTVLSIYGITPGPAVNLASQLIGVEMIHIAVICWLARRVSDGAAQKAIILGGLVGQVIAVIVSMIGTLSGVFSAMGWSAVVIYLLLALGYAYLQFMKPSRS
jgi:hypothetical protein